ncbi:hydrogenase maturation nickel metallochaperone HypA [uncultured Mailhella sp.]|uniref:hydrogenase maturation nickel metallochaperone HypA/HybF n=1 Tax=uncultured Mailhella sp. TaxID=1981031 RepID=UPI0026390814|nr:hydrogenase maturation nickel metallochaperone HypA [uncultured Mailhella sp.]
MHELSLMAGVMDLARQELERHGASRLTLMRLRFGELDQVLPDALRMAFAAMTAGTSWEGARLELEEEPLELSCPLCGHRFRPGARSALYAPCPSCGETTGFGVVRGEGVFLDHLEAE